MTPLLVKIPCRRFRVSVRLGPATGIGHFESLLLRRIGIEPATLPEVAAFFGLPEPLVLDRIVALFRLDLLAIESGGTRLYLGEKVLGAMGDPEKPNDGWQELLGFPGTTVREVDLLREMVSGAVFTSMRRDRGQWQQDVPVSLDLPPIEDIPKPVLLSAATSRLRQERTKLQNLRVLDVACVGGQDALSVTVEQYDFIVVEMIGFNLDGESPSFSVVGPGRIGRRVRDAIADGITKLHNRGLAQELVRSLRASANQAAGPPPQPSDDAETLLERLRDTLSSVDDRSRRANLESAQALAIETARDLDDVVSAALTHEGHSEVVVSVADHRQLLLSALQKTAQYQVVLAVPRIDGLARDQELQDALVAAVSRGVRVHLLWGYRKGLKFEEEFAALRPLVELLRPQDQNVGGLFVATSSTPLHGSAFAVDVRQVCIGSFPWFSFRSAVRPAVSLLLPSMPSIDETNPRRKVPTAVIELLQLMRQACPEAAFRRVISTDPVIDGGQMIVEDRNPLGYPDAAPDENPLAIAIWQREWQRWIDDIVKTHVTVKKSVRLIALGSHRRLLVRAFERARRRIVVASPRLGDGVLGQAIEPHLLGALERGVRVEFVHREVVPRDPLVRQLRRLKDLGVITRSADLDGNFVVVDDEAIISSFRFGSADGELDLIELGFAVVDRGVADKLVQIVSQPSASHAGVGGVGSESRTDL